MKYLLHICSRLALIIVVAAFFTTTAMAGYARLDPSCCGDCCAVKAHDSAGKAKVRLSSAMPIMCCGGMDGQTCDLSTQPGYKDHYQNQVITSTIDGLSSFVGGGQTIKVTPDNLIIKIPPVSARVSESIPIYLAYQSFLI